MHIQMLDGKPVLPIFDYKKRLRDTAYVPRGSNCISIVYLKDMWFNNNKFGFNWILIQSKVYLPFVFLAQNINVGYEEDCKEGLDEAD